jgi:hypothetical protein
MKKSRFTESRRASPQFNKALAAIVRAQLAVETCAPRFRIHHSLLLQSDAKGMPGSDAVTGVLFS